MKIAHGNCHEYIDVNGSYYRKLYNPSQAMPIYIANHDLLSFEFKSQAFQVHNYDYLLDSER